MENIECVKTGGQLWLTFNRPERKNALTTVMYRSLNEALEQARDAEDVKVVVISGAAGVFTAGNDLDDFISHPPDGADAAVFTFFRNLATFPKPVLAAVEGLAIGIGTTMLLLCDLVYVGERTKFSTPFTKLGLSPEGGSSLLLQRTAGYQSAAEKLFFGEVFGADEAFAMGFVTRVLVDGEVGEYAQAQANKLARLPLGSLIATKSLLRRGAGDSPDGANEVERRIIEEAEIFAKRVRGDAAKEAIAAFKEKRAPDFDRFF